MYCKFCGKSIPEKTLFCRFCGEKINGITVQTEITEEAKYSSKENFVSRASRTTLELVVTILILINFFSGIVGGIWLAFSGGLSLVLYGIGLSIFMPWGYSIAFLPQMGLAALLVNFVEKGNKLVVGTLGFITSVYGNFILTIWSIFVFESLVKNQPQPIIPLLLWGYSTVMAPLSYMVSKEPPDSSGTSMGLLFVQLSFVVLTVLFIVGSYDSARNVALGILILLFSSLTVSAIIGSMITQRSQLKYSE